MPTRDEDVAALYQAPPELFVAARDTLARRLRHDGDPGTAAEVHALRRPTVPAWLLNVVATQDPDLVAEALELGTQLRTAQAEALAGRGAAAPRPLMERRRQLVQRVTNAAADVAADHDRPMAAAHRDAVQATVEAALADESVAAQWAAARLTQVAQAAGFAFGSAVDSTPTAPSPRQRAPSASTTATSKTTSPRVEKSPRRPSPGDPARTRAVGVEPVREAEQKATALRRAADAARDEVARHEQLWVEADRVAREAKQALRAAQSAASRAELFAATAEQAAWEAAERARRK